MSTDSPVIFAVVLAAGSGRRFGGTKQLEEIDGESLVHRAARLARELRGGHSLLVVGHDADAVSTSAAGECRFLALNERHVDGLGTSLALAARILADMADAFILLLADQPRITLAHLEALVAAWDGKPDSIVATAYAGTLGAPALLAAGSFDKLAALDGDVGARSLFDNPAFDLSSVPFEDAAVDVDTPADLDAL